MHVAVIGAGPAGMTAALRLSQGGARVSVYEASENIGGLARSITLWGQRVDIGPHRFFSTDARINRLWLEIVQHEYRMVNRLTRIFYQGRFFHYPLRPFDALSNMGPITAARCIASYGKEKLVPSTPRNGEPTFESWVVDRFGRRLFEMFFKSYSEKLWGIPCEEIDADFAAQRIKKFSLREAIKSAFSLRSKVVHKTLVDRFAYPLAGTGSVYEKMAERIRELGGEIHLRTPVQEVVHQDRKVCELVLAGGRRVPCDRVVSTMPLTLLIRGLQGVPAEVTAAADSLEFRNTVLVYLHVDKSELFSDQWIYIHSPELLMGRVTNFRNWVPELCHGKTTTILAAEYWCYNSDSLWQEADESLIDRATRELRSTGLLDSAAVLDGHVVRVPRCYPVYRRGYRQHVQKLANYLRELQGLFPIGRYGAFKYNNQDHSILMGILAAENILDDCVHDLWSVNTDFDDYQEAALISETGLQFELVDRQNALS